MDKNVERVEKPVPNEQKSIRLFMAMLLIVVFLVTGSVAGFMGYSNRATEDAVHNVSLFYLEELSSNVSHVFTTHFDGYFKELWLAMLTTSEAEIENEKLLNDHLEDMAERGDFLFYALLDENGNVHMSDDSYLDANIKATLDERDFTKQQLWVQTLGEEKVVVIAEAAPEGSRH